MFEFKNKNCDGATDMHEFEMSIMGFAKNELWINYKVMIKCNRKKNISGLLVIRMIKYYQNHISIYFQGQCIYQPTCSQYAIDAISIYGPVNGIILTIKRLLRCRSKYEGGYDPVVENKFRQQKYIN
jgi:putative membrane protein insertion efficiency factor